MIYDCIIVGAGASGLFAGARFDTAAEGCPHKSQSAGNRPTGSRPSSRPTKHCPAGLILEKTGRAGTKLLMSGGGQCNITHGGSIKDFIDRYGKKGGRIRSCLYKHNNLELISFLEKNGIPTVTQEEDGRVFPASRKAQDIRDLLVRKSQENGFEIGVTNSPVTPVFMKGGIPEATNLIVDLREKHNLFCSVVVYPVIPKGEIILRLIPTAAHTLDDVKFTIEAFKAIRNKLESGFYRDKPMPMKADEGFSVR